MPPSVGRSVPDMGRLNGTIHAGVQAFANHRLLNLRAGEGWELVAPTRSFNDFKRAGGQTVKSQPGSAGAFPRLAREVNEERAGRSQALRGRSVISA
jgi:hypothetical protein